MRDLMVQKARRAIEISIAFAPWLVSMYILYRLEHGEIWSDATPHRGKISFTVLVVGMGLSFLVYHAIARRKQQ